MAEQFSNMEGETTWGTYGAAATAFNAQSLADFNYSSNTANTVSAALSTATGQTYTLTAGVDNIVGGALNDTINGLDNAGLTQNNWNALDTIDGGAGTNTFTVASALAIVLPAAATVTNIQTANFVESGTATAVTLNATAWAGLTALNVTNADTGIDTLTAAATTNVKNTGTSTGAVKIYGGKDVTVVSAGGAVEVGSAVTATKANAAGNITVTDTAAATAAVLVDGGVNQTITITGAAAANAATAQVTSGVSTQATGAVVVNATTGTANGNTIGAISVKGGTTVTVNETAGNAAAGSNDVAMGNVAVTGTAITTAVTVNQAAVATGTTAVTAIPGVAGVAAVPAAPGTQPVALVTAVNFTKAVTGVVGVSADGTVAITDKYYNTTTANTISSITLSNFGTTTIHANGVTALSLSGTGAAATITNATNGSGTVPTANATLALAVNNLSGATLIDANTEITTLNVTTGATASALAVTDGALTTLSVAGASTLTMTPVASLTSITVSGAAGFNDGGTTSHAAAYTGFGALGAAATITTTSSGAITLHLDDTTQTFTGSTGKDTITVSSLADATTVITGGSGTTDELVLEGGAYALTAASASKLTGFETLGVAANVTGNVDMTNLGAGFTGLHIIGNSTVGFTKVAAATNLTLDGTSTSVTVQKADATGAADSITVTLGKSTSDTVNFGTVVLRDANAVGVGTVNLVSAGVDISNGDATANNNTVILTDNGLSVLNVSGSQGLLITTNIQTATQATSFTLNNTNTGSYGVVIGTLTDTNLGNLVFTGTGASTISTLTDATSTTLAISNTGAKMATVGTFTSSAVLTSLTLTGNVQIGDGLVGGTGLTSTATTGVTVSGATDNAHVKLTLGAAALGNTNSVTLGNGNNAVTDATIAGTSNVTVGTGSNFLTVGGATTNTTGAFNITLGAHTSTTGIDTIVVGTGGTAYASAANYVITGAAVGDKIVFNTDAGATLVGHTAGVITATTAGATAALTITALETAVDALAAHGVAYAVFGGNTYVAESIASALGGTDTTIIKLVGVHTVTATTGAVLVAS